MEFIKNERRGSAAIITFDRQNVLNALNGQVLDELAQTVEQVMKSGDVQALIFTGAGKSFIAGADTNILSNPDHVAVLAYTYKGRDVLRSIEVLPIPTIAAINGYAFGGGLEFALCCDFRIASESAKLGLPEASLGITPGFSGTQRLPRVVGSSRAKELIFTGKTLTAQDAFSWGLVNQVVPKETLMEETLKFAESMTKNSPYAISYCKKEIDRGIDLDIQSGIELETGYLGMIFGSPDQVEGFAAMNEKRAPKFLEPGDDYYKK